MLRSMQCNALLRFVRTQWLGAAAVVFLFFLAALIPASAFAAPFQAGYYNSSWGDTAAFETLDWPAFNFIYHFNAYPVISNSTCSLDTSELVNAGTLVATAHAKGARIVVTIFGTSQFNQCTDTATHINQLTTAIYNFVSLNKYDGVDIDWETTVNSAYYGNFLASLRSQLNAYTPPMGRPSDGKPYITEFAQDGIAAANMDTIDLVNLSCYDDHVWPLSKVWHDAALHDPGDNGATGGGYSCANLVASAVDSGIPQSKIGVALPFYIRDWVGGMDASGNGTYYPGQVMSIAPNASSLQSLNQLYSATDPVTGTKLWQSQFQHRDIASGNVPYLSINLPGSASDHFITYPDPASVTSGWNFVAAGYNNVPLASFTAYNTNLDYQKTLSEALRNAALGTVVTPPPVSTTTAPVISSFTANPASINSGQSTSLSWNVSGSPLPTLVINNGVGAVTGTSVTVTPAQTTAYTLTAQNSAGSSLPASVTVTVAVADSAAPSVPQNLIASAVSPSQINLSWTASQDNIAVASYAIYRNGLPVGTALTNSYADGGLAAATTYTYTVVAMDAAGNSSSQSAAVAATTQSGTIAFAAGVRVKTTASVNVRSKAGTGKTSKILCTKPAGTLGTIIDGPFVGSGYTWWKINYDTGCDGWSAQNYLTTNIGSVLGASALSLTKKLYPGSRDAQVLILQQLLASRGYLDASLLSGVFDTQTTEAVKKFQADAHVPATGIVGTLTQKALAAE